jgi:serine/threonine-protein kinase RsbT
MTDQVHQSRAPTLMHEMGINEANLERRKKAVALEPSDLAKIAMVRDVVVHHVEDLTATFFDHVVARRTVRELGEEQGLVGSAIEAMATAVTEIGRNMVVHGGGGELLLGTTRAADPPRSGIIVTATDTGPGIAHVELALGDGYSTVGSLGLGLPSARRLVDEFEIRSTVGQGTTVTLRKWASGQETATSAAVSTQKW